MRNILLPMTGFVLMYAVGETYPPLGVFGVIALIFCTVCVEKMHKSEQES